MTARCFRCGRKLTRPGRGGYGPSCATAVLGPVARQQRAPRIAVMRHTSQDERQSEMFAEVMV
jgi:hypothetical protein